MKGNAEIRSSDGRVVARGIAYLHLPRGVGVRQSAGGTVSCRMWDQTAGEPAVLAVEHGPEVRIRVSKEAVSECSRNHILRYTADWEPTATGGA